MKERPLSILLLADDQRGNPETIHDHIRMFPRYSRHDVRVFNPRGLRRSRAVDLDAYDVVVVHYSLVLIWDSYVAPWFRERLRAFSGLKVQFLQDEYRFVDAITAEMKRVGIDVLYSCAPPAIWGALYGDRLPETELLPTLTGYVPERLRRFRGSSLDARPIDVGYRGRSLPFWLGRLGYEKIEIGRGFLSRADRLGLRCDIAWTESARIYGRRWQTFVTSCRTMLASESGSSILDWDGSVEASVRAYLADHPASDYLEVEAAVLPTTSEQVSLNTISPRLFEAAALGTGMILFPGEYSGIVRLDEHCLMLAKDFSNAEEVAEGVRDSAYLAARVAAAHEDLIASGRYSERVFVERFDREIAERAQPRRSRGRAGSRLGMTLEQASAGRGYHLSALYSLARESILAYLGLKNALREPALRWLLRHARRPARAAGDTSLWDDLFRLAILTSVQRGRPVLAGTSFHVVAELDPPAGRLTLTSVAGETPRRPDEEDIDRLGAAAQGGDLREIVWSHATLEQYVPLRFGPTGLRIAFDVGRYDAYGVYRFDALAALVRERPEMVVAVLAPLIQRPVDADNMLQSTRKAKRGPNL